MRRRKYLKSIGAGAAIAGLAGCAGGGGGSDTATGSDDTATEDEADTMTSTETEAATEGADNPYDIEGGVVTIGSDIPYNPFAYPPESGELTGSHVDIAEADFVYQLVSEYAFQTSAFDTTLPSLTNGSCRAHMSPTTPNDERD